MRRFGALGVLMLAALVCGPASLRAGEPPAKCTMSTQECLDAMVAAWKDRGWAGMELQPDPATGAQMVTDVVMGSPAASAGIAKGDLLTAVNGVKVEQAKDAAWRSLLTGMKPGTKVVYTLKRGSTELKIPVTLIEVPHYVLAGYVGRHMLAHVRPPQ